MSEIMFPTARFCAYLSMSYTSACVHTVSWILRVGKNRNDIKAKAIKIAPGAIFTSCIRHTCPRDFIVFGFLLTCNYARCSMDVYSSQWPALVRRYCGISGLDSHVAAIFLYREVQRLEVMIWADMLPMIWADYVTNLVT